MGYTKDLWTRPEPGPDDTIRRVRNARWGKGKRWLACWIDPDGHERSKAFRIQTAANSYWKAMEADKDRGDYHDPRRREDPVQRRCPPLAPLSCGGPFDHCPV